MSESLLRLEAVVGRVALRPSTIYRLISEGKFPRPVTITGSVRGWLNSEIAQWIISRAEARDNEGDE